MPYQVLARKYRPLRFSDVAGQDHVTRTLQNALEQGRVAHGYIFSGHRGIGKTTIARILASALNCQNAIGSPQRPTPEPCLQCDSCREIRTGNAVDVIEIDAATNRGIDEIRELRDAARYSPARDRFKIIILDEAHQITDAAFNALLKTLEEPPEHIVFMMATTEPENIPQTIRSRCQHFSFHAVKLDDILGQLRKISIDENVLADDAALDLLAEAGDGSMRDALSIMDQAIASAPVVDGKPQLSSQEIRDLMGSVPNTVFEEILEHVSANQAAGVLTTANRLLDAGNSPAQIARQFVRYLRNCVVAKIANLTPDSPDTELLQISPDERRRAARSSMLFTEEELTRFLQVMLRTFDDLGFRQEQRFHLELGLLKLVHLQRLLPMEHFLSQLPRPNTNRRIAAQPPLPRKPTPDPPPTRLTAASTESASSNVAARITPQAPNAPPSAQPKVAPAPAATLIEQGGNDLQTIPHVPGEDGIPAPTFNDAIKLSTPKLSEGPGLSPVIHPFPEKRASAPEGAVTAAVSPVAHPFQTPSAPPSAGPAADLSVTPEVDTTQTTVPHVPREHRIPASAEADASARNSLWEGPGFSPAIQPGPEKGASAPEGIAVAVNPFGPRSVPQPPSPIPATEPSNVPALARPNAITGPDPSTGIDPHLPPIDAYELDAIAASAEDDNTPPPPAPDPEAQPAPEIAGDAAPLQAAAVEALFAAGSQNSAAEQLEETTWTIAEGEVRVQTSLSKPMVNTIFRPEAQAIIRAAITKSGAAGLKLTFLPGNVNDKPKAAAKKPRTGSAQAKALEHPTVQAAQRLFNAEVTNVFDLRKD